MSASPAATPQSRQRRLSPGGAARPGAKPAVVQQQLQQLAEHAVRDRLQQIQQELLEGGSMAPGPTHLQQAIGRCGLPLLHEDPRRYWDVPPAPGTVLRYALARHGSAGISVNTVTLLGERGRQA